MTISWLVTLIMIMITLGAVIFVIWFKAYLYNYWYGT